MSSGRPPSPQELLPLVGSARAARSVRPPGELIVAPGPGQESVWDFPRPPRVEPVALPVRVAFGGRVIADSTRALRVVETAGAPCYYLPPEDCAPGALVRAERWTVCEWKGVAYAYDVHAGERVARGGAWSYPEPLDDLGMGYRAHRRLVRLLRRGDGRVLAGRRAGPPAAGRLLRRLDQRGADRPDQGRAGQRRLVTCARSRRAVAGPGLRNNTEVGRVGGGMRLRSLPWAAGLAALVAAGALTAAPAPAVTGPAGTFAAVRTAKPPPLDAALSDPLWAQALGGARPADGHHPAAQPLRLAVPAAVRRPEPVRRGAAGAARRAADRDPERQRGGLRARRFRRGRDRPQRQRRAGLLLHDHAAGDALPAVQRVGPLRPALVGGRRRAPPRAGTPCW